MKKIKTFGLALGMGTVAIAPATQAAQLTLNFDAFIPAARVANPLADVLPPFFTEFTGDNRDFSFEATRNGEARLFSEVVLDTDASEPLVSTLTSGGTTVGFLVLDGVEISQSAQAIAKSSVEATRMSENEILLQVDASTTNPLIDDFLPPEVEVPPAEYRYDIMLTLLDGGIAYEIEGTNREFPSYSVFLNRTPILLNPANGEDSQLLFNVESVSAAGTIAVSEPGTLLALGIMGAGMLIRRNCQH